MFLEQDLNYLNFFRHIVLRGMEKGLTTPKEWIKNYTENAKEKLYFPEYTKTRMNQWTFKLCADFYFMEKGEKPGKQQDIIDWLTKETDEEE
jgi:hypothetical protein